VRRVAVIITNTTNSEKLRVVRLCVNDMPLTPKLNAGSYVSIDSKFDAKFLRLTEVVVPVVGKLSMNSWLWTTSMVRRGKPEPPSARVEFPGISNYDGKATPITFKFSVITVMLLKVSTGRARTRLAKGRAGMVSCMGPAIRSWVGASGTDF